ncbi:MAG: methyltransferase domain-containing protein [Bacteroidetes bacterium]|nr:methyltransferase domain-containing protein [Bacteroidota bacterium]
MTETTFESTFALDTAHPNYERWQRAIDHARLRGDAVCDALESFMDLKGAVVLDAGCGVGGTSAALHARGADVIAVDCNADRLDALNESLPDVETAMTDLTSLPYPDASFDAIVLQDVLEHVASPAEVLMEISRVLTPQGLLYMSTPNRNALTNIISDPHFGLPLASLKRRDELRAMLRKKRPADAAREDLAQLLSFAELTGLLHASGLQASFINHATALRLFDRPESLVWSDGHLRTIRLLRRSGLKNLVLRLVSDEPGFFNSWINPAWYLICRKDL